MEPNWTDEEILMELNDVFNDALSGRADVHTCPKCSKKSLQSEVDEGHVKLECNKCGFTFEGYLR